ncbi:MAG: winged helix-turn-helix domain-containing protein [Chloroflexi bacterium]|nr:winged helix-turn-helix domain-containing protein [Chloroflexota bacterium]
MVANQEPQQRSLERNLEGEGYRELRLLEEVESRPEVSQRYLARQLNVALGVANLLVRTLVRKGYIRASRVGWKRWVYVLTPAGIAHKVQLTLAYIERFVDHYRRVRNLLRTELAALDIDTDSRVAIYGTTEFAEMIYLALRELGVAKIDFFDREQGEKNFLGQPVWGLDQVAAEDYAIVLVAHMTEVPSRLEELQAGGLPSGRAVALLQRSMAPVPEGAE